MIKIKVSYESPEELMRLLAVLGDRVESWKVSRNQEGRYRKAYIILKV